jgi:hypothetical protein
MKAHYKLYLIGTMLVLSGLTGSCGKSGGGDTLTDIYIPDIDGNWVNSANANDEFNFVNAPQNGAATGTFQGTESINGTQVATLSGSFNHSKINFTLTFDTSTEYYSGTVSGTSPKMVLKSSAHNLTLTKQ